MLKILRKSKFKDKLIAKYPRQYNYFSNIIYLLKQREIKLLAPYIAFFILLSFIPIITLIFEVVFLTINNNQEIIDVLREALPSHVFTILIRLIDHNPSHIKIMTISNLILVFIASKIYLSFYNSYLLIYNVRAKGFYLKGRIVAFINTFLLIILIFFISILTLFSSYIFNFLTKYFDYRLINFFYNYVNLILAIMIISSIVTFMMYSIPDIKQKIKDVIQGAVFVTFGWIVVSYGFKIYTDRFADYQTVYKTFASIIIFVIWIYLLSYVLIIGIVINRAKISTHESSVINKNSNEYTERSEYK